MKLFANRNYLQYFIENIQLIIINNLVLAKHKLLPDYCQHCYSTMVTELTILNFLAQNSTC